MFCVVLIKVFNCNVDSSVRNMRTSHFFLHSIQLMCTDQQRALFVARGGV